MATASFAQRGPGMMWRGSGGWGPGTQYNRMFEKQSNIQLNARTTTAEYVAIRNRRHAHLPMTTLIHPFLQVNIRAGRLPDPESNGVSYLRIPLNAL